MISEPIVEVRDVRREDLPELRKLWERQGIDYMFPDLANPLYFLKKVIVVDSKIVNCILCRVEVETLMLNDRDWGCTEDKLDAAGFLLGAVEKELKSKGLDTLVAWVPRHVEKAMEPHLKALGWEPDREAFHTWSKRI